MALPEEKQNRIRNAALREFGKYGYEKTSVESIAKEAKISKGMVFHYFDTKLGLFEYLSEYMYDYLSEYIINITENIANYDYLDRLKELSRIKLSAYVSNPYVFEFSTMFMFHPKNLEVSDKVKKIQEELMSTRQTQVNLLVSKPDEKNLRDDISKEHTENYLEWIIEGYTNKLMKEFAAKSLSEMDLDPYWEEFDEILEDLKIIFYKGDK